MVNIAILAPPLLHSLYFPTHSPTPCPLVSPEWFNEKCLRGEWVVQCPKEKQVELTGGTLAEGLVVNHCPDCEGMWISAEDYKSWQSHQGSGDEIVLPTTLDVAYTPASFDSRGALCPECNCYLARAKVSLKTPFYVERCVNCGGIWCDRGEWEVLQFMGIHTAIDQLFSSEWQTRVKELESAERERRATIEKLGEDLAYRVFELAELLENHPNGDFGVAYLMRRFDQ
ncbi:zf-TFIIB domain-containing protein [Oscillatoria sp. FACHB-1407]|uniref:zf-TFIIB domain-containing protein n=1 Tax=Oscillatoria sp. FACHB-1407 TaxID=2692847 RepID=UPI0028160E9B|nr:zf-TFIIB domain-containing protein [Oscillatoria sp. FACHB-1407]